MSTILGSTSLESDDEDSAFLPNTPSTTATTLSNTPSTTDTNLLPNTPSTTDTNLLPNIPSTTATNLLPTNPFALPSLSLEGTQRSDQDTESDGDSIPTMTGSLNPASSNHTKDPVSSSLTKRPAPPPPPITTHPPVTTHQSVTGTNMKGSQVDSLLDSTSNLPLSGIRSKSSKDQLDNISGISAEEAGRRRSSSSSSVRSRR